MQPEHVKIAAPDYWNAVCQLRTRLSPKELLSELLRSEQLAGRQRPARWASRCLDLDLLLYDQQQISVPGLEVPHPGIACRVFVLRPLFDLAPALLVPPLGRSVSELLAALAELPDGIIRTVADWQQIV